MTRTCPDCGGRVHTETQQLTESEHVEIMDCESCPWTVETMSNKAWEDRTPGGVER